MNLLHHAHSRATAIYLLVALMVAGGIYAAFHLPSAIFPEVTFPMVKVIADVGEEPAARMIPTVTRPLEQAVDRVPGMRRVLSTTSRGSVEMSAEFAWGTNMEVALERVRAEVARIRPELPPGASVEAEWMNTTIFPILGYSLTSDTVPLWKLSQLAEYTLKPALIRIPGVSRIQIQGERLREFQVHLDLAALAARHLKPDDVVAAIGADNQILSSGLVEKNHELYLTLVDGRATSLAALGEINVPVPGGVPARLADLGTLKAADAVSYVRTTANGHEAVLVNIIQQPSANTLDIADGVKRLLATHPELIPKGVKWQTFYDQASFIRSSVTGVRDAILIGVALAALVLLLFLRDWKVTLIAVLMLPINVALVLLGLAATGQTVNLMTLGGIAAALGLVADDAIVVVENIHRHRENAISKHPALSGTVELMPALIGSSLSTIVVFLPFAFLSGIAGAFFKPLALTMALSLIGSFLLAAFALPAVVRWMDRNWVADEEEIAELQDEQRPLARFFRHIAGWGPLAALLLVALLGGGYLLYRAIDTDFLPAMDEGSIILDYWTPPGTSLSETDAMLRIAEKQIDALPDVASYSRRTGTQLGFFITEPNRGDYVINLRPRGHRRPIQEVMNDLRQRFAKVEPAIHTDFGQLIEDDIGDLTGGEPQPIDVMVYGEDHVLLEKTARRIAAIISKIPGIEDVFNGITIAGPPLNLKTRPAELARRDLTTGDLDHAVKQALVGTVAGDLRLGERVYNIRVFAGNNHDLSNLNILLDNGTQVPLATLADVSTGPPEAEIDRDNLKSYLGVTARLSGRSLGSTVATIKHLLAQKLTLPAGMSIEYGGLYAQQQESFKGLLVVLLAGLLLVSVVLLFEFGDWRAPFLTVLTALAVLIGVFGALMICGMTLNITSFVGAIMMVGIAGENSVFVIHEARLELLRGKTPRVAWAIAAARRLRPVAMTVLATGFALLPLAIALGQGSQLLQPLAVAVIGGFIVSGPLVIFILPPLYKWIDPNGRLAAHVVRREAREEAREEAEEPGA